MNCATSYDPPNGLFRAISEVRSPAETNYEANLKPATRSRTTQTAQGLVDAEQPAVEESIEARTARLGRQRPTMFATVYSEIAFVTCTVMSQILTEYFVAGFTVIVPQLIQDLKIPQSSSVWPASAMSLVIASTLLVFGRLGDKYGGYPVYLFGLAWFVLWSVVAGFSSNPLMLDFCRALQGLGAAAYLPASVMLLGSIYRPGPRKNLVFALYGTCAVIGFFVGIFVAGLVGQFLRWGWYFWIGAILTFLVFLTSIFAIPNDHATARKNQVKMDWLGATTMVPGLVFFVFALTESSHAPHGWRTWYIPTLLVLGIILLALTVYIASQPHLCRHHPLLPLDIFRVRAMTPVILALLLLYGTMGVYLLYGTQYFERILHATPLQVVGWYTPMVIGGLIFSTAEGFIMHLVSGRTLLILAGVGAVGAQLLLALLPPLHHSRSTTTGQSLSHIYWPYILPSMVLGTMGIDLAINVSAVFLTTSLPAAQQGLAGGLINTVLQLGLAVSLAVADTVQSGTFHPTTSNGGEAGALRTSFKNCFWTGVAMGTMRLLLVAVWGKVGRARSELTADEKKEVLRAEKGDGGMVRS